MAAPPSVRLNGVAMTSWVGRLFLGDGWLVYAGPVGPTALHEHHAFQLGWTVDDVLVLKGAEDREVACTAVAIGPDVSHTIRQGASGVLLVYEDPDTLRGRRLRSFVPATPSAVDWVAAGAPLETLRSVSLPVTWEASRTARDAALHRLVPLDARTAILHPAVTRARAWLVEHLDDEDLSLHRVAAASGLSGDRLSHVLNDELGLGLRPLILWLRMQRAARELAEGRSLSLAAASAGFADGPHLTRTFRRMFGLAPSELVGLVEWVLPP